MAYMFVKTQGELILKLVYQKAMGEKENILFLSYVEDGVTIVYVALDIQIKWKGTKVRNVHVPNSSPKMDQK